jgi:mRNA interferase MazF
MKCGDVLLVSYPFTDATGAKIRPVLVVSTDVFNNGDDVVLVPISSAPAATDPYVFPIHDTDPFFAVSGLKRSSAIKWTKPLTVSRSVVRSRLGSLPAEQLAIVHTKLRSLFTA